MTAPSVSAGPHPRGWLLVLGTIVAIGPLTIDMYLPAMPALQRHFGVSAGQTQLTLAVFFAGLAAGQLVYGPLSDRFGRRKPLLFGLSLYALASLACAFAPSMQALIALRLLEALGGCTGMVIPRAMVRDRYDAQDMARILSNLVLVMGIAPILAPVLGGQVYLLLGWQAIFLMLAGFGALCVALAWRFLPESLARPSRVTVASALHNYLRLLGHRRFMGYALSGGLAQSGMFAYISVSAFVFIDHFRLSPTAFSALFGCNAFGLIASSQINARLLERFPSQIVLRAALRTYAAAGVAMLAAAFTGWGGFWGVAAPLFVAMSSLGFTFPNSTAGAMAPFGDRAGTAAALLGSLQFGLAATTGTVAGHLHDGTPVPMAAVIAVAGAAAETLLGVLVGVPARAPRESA